MKFVGFEYKSQDEVTIVLRESRVGGAVDLDKWDLPVDSLRDLHERIDCFLALFDNSILTQQ